MSIFLKTLFIIACLSGSIDAFAYKLRCNTQQSVCQVETKRLTVGDKVGIFDKDGYIVAIGKVFKLAGRVRYFKITHKYSKILASHDGILIRDSEAQNPKNYFKMKKTTKQKGFGGHIGITAMGVGDGISAFTVGGYKLWKWRQSFFWTARGFFMLGEGNASSTGQVLVSEHVKYSAIGALGGISYLLLPAGQISPMLGMSIGLVNVSLDTERSDAKDLVDGQVFPGMGTVFRASGSLLFRMYKNRPFVGAAFYKLQNSFNFSFYGGWHF